MNFKENTQTDGQFFKSLQCKIPLAFIFSRVLTPDKI